MSASRTNFSGIGRLSPESGEGQLPGVPAERTILGDGRDSFSVTPQMSPRGLARDDGAMVTLDVAGRKKEPGPP